VIDATCPLVTKVHLEAIRYAKRGYHIVLIGHRNHVEVEGTMGEAPDSITLVESPSDVINLKLPQVDKLVYLTQTTLSVDDTTEVIQALKVRYPNIEAPPTDDICYATTNRQMAIKEMARQCDLILVIGSRTSSNSNRLVEVAISNGCRSKLINDSSDLVRELFEGAENVGITAGASAPEILVQDVVRWMEKQFTVQFADLDVIEEDVVFTLPREIAGVVRGSKLGETLLTKHVVSKS